MIASLSMPEFVQYVQGLSPILIYVIVFVSAYVENVFPPSPSDLILVFAGSLIPLGRIGFIETLVITNIGSTLGFLTMYHVGEWFGEKLLLQGKIKFLPIESFRKVEQWFARYGYAIIVVNRFLAGTRAVVSFFAGVARLRLLPTTILCFFSALIWNGLLLTSGYFLGQNWEQIGWYLSSYSEIVTLIFVLIVGFFVGKHYYKKQKRKGES